MSYTSFKKGGRTAYNAPACLPLELLSEELICASVPETGTLDSYTQEDFPW